MAQWRADHKIEIVGVGVAMLTTLAQIFSEYMREHWYYACAAGIVAILMIVIPLIHTFIVWLKRRNAASKVESPLEIIFEPLNPAQRFWSLESHVDDYKRLIGNFWEHRVEIRNNSSVTLRNVVVTVERTGIMPVRPQRALFVRTKSDSCSINPGCNELVLVNRWSHPKSQVGNLAGDSAWGYGPIEVIASADDVHPTKVIFDFNYETEQMLFERGKY